MPILAQLHLCGKDNDNEKNSHAKIKRSTQTQLQRQLKYLENQCWQYYR